MRLRVPLLFASVAALAGAVTLAAGGADFESRAALVEEARLSEAFAAVAVKAERPMPWPTFVDLRYREFKGDGDVAEGDLPRDPDAAIWLAILDREYRTQAKLLFLEGGKLPPVPEDRWVSLAEIEQEIMPALRHGAAGHVEEEIEAEAGELVARARSLYELSWEGLQLVPGATAEEGWGPVAPESEAGAHVAALTEAYRQGEAEAMYEAASQLGATLAGQAGYPPAAKVKLEIYLEKFALLKIAFFGYLLSSLLFFAWAAFRRKTLASAAVIVAAVAFLFMTAGLTIRSIVAGYLPTTGMYEYLVLFSWAAVLVFLVFYLKTRQAFLGTIVMPVAFLLIVLSSLFPSKIEGQLIPALQSWWLTIHVTLACLGEGAFAVGFAAAVLYLFRGDKPGRILPPKDTLDLIEYRAVAIGYPLFTIGALVAGAIWAQKAWSVWWSWDPKETASLVVFLVATAYLHARRLRGWRGRRSAILAILIFLLAVATLFSNMIFGGLHSYGV
ncbi:MAG: c-type cytochrome biogenesis protein CcsB [Candidatus Coatesbacteria bacterium]|nr:MAG: c-type cytochrome biogenesis protein CcsB [Candidatus Coatesbacteria bacterium]